MTNFQLIKIIEDEISELKENLIDQIDDMDEVIETAINIQVFEEMKRIIEREEERIGITEEEYDKAAIELYWGAYALRKAMSDKIETYEWNTYLPRKTYNIHNEDLKR